MGSQDPLWHTKWLWWWTLGWYVCIIQYQVMNDDLCCSIDAFKLTSAQWSFSTPRLLQTASIDMKTAFTTATFYTAMTNPTVCQILNLPILNQEQVYAWSALIFSSGIVYRSYATRWQQQKQITPEEEEKKDQ